MLLKLMLGRTGLRLCQQFIEGLERMSTATDNLAAAVTALEAEAATLGTTLQTAVTDLGAISNDAGDQALADRINAVVKNLTDAQTALTAAEPDLG